jgi:hypothetical protein
LDQQTAQDESEGSEADGVPQFGQETPGGAADMDEGSALMARMYPVRRVTPNAERRVGPGGARRKGRQLVVVLARLRREAPVVSACQSEWTDRDEEPLPRGRVNGADHDDPGPRAGRRYAELVGGPLGGLPAQHHRQLPCFTRWVPIWNVKTTGSITAR